MIRTPAALLPYLLAVAAVVAGVLWHAGDHVAGIGRNIESGSASVGSPFSLIDQSGSVRTDKDFRGRFMLVYFGYSYCPDVCPTTLAVMANALDKLGTKRARIAPIFISVDPERDRPKVLKDYLNSFAPDFVGLTGSAKAVSEAARAYRVYFKKHNLPNGGYAVDHSSIIYLMGPDGHFVTYYEETIGPDALAADLSKRL